MGQKRFRPAWARWRLPPGPMQGDYIMAMNRAVCGLFMLLFSVCVPSALPPGTWVLPILAWLACGGAVLASMVLAPGSDALRRTLALALDIGGATIMLAAGGQATAFLYVVYQWIIIGNGYRFGGIYALLGSAGSMAGFGLVMVHDPFWQQHLSLSLGLLSGLLVLPGYSFLLIRQLKKARQEAEQANKAKSNFLAGVSHELRTPLNAIVGTAELLRKTTLDSEQRAMLSTLNTAAEGQLALVDDLLAFANGKADQDQPNIAPFDLTELVAAVGAMIGPQARRKELRFDTAVALGTPGRLSGDARRIREVLLNLCSNAVKFTASGSITLLATGEDDGAGRVWLRFEVRDTGIGIAPEAQQRVFEPFTQADDTILNRFGGTGLGLALCERQVKLMGGTIGVDSTPGVGSTFRVALHLAHAPASDASASGETEAEATARADAAALAGVRVLVADDNDINRTILGRMLKGAGLDVVFAVNGEQALSVLTGGGVDVALLDVNMPVMDGVETAEMYAFSCLGGARVPLIALTAGVTEDTRAKCVAAGMETVLVKPVRTAELLRVLAGTVPARPAAAPAEPVDASDVAVDADRIHSLETLGGPEFIAMLAQDFERDGSLLLSDIESACLGRDVSTFRTAAHSLASVSANMGAVRIGRLCGSWQGIAEAEFERQRGAIPGQLSAAWNATTAAFAQWTGESQLRRARL